MLVGSCNRIGNTRHIVRRFEVPGSMDRAADCALRGVVLSDAISQEPLYLFRPNGVARTMEARRYREVERKLGDDGRFRATHVADDIECVFEIFDVNLHAVASIV